MATNLSKSWTLSSALGVLRSVVNEIAPDKVQDLQMIDMLHLAICDVAELLNGAAFPDYGVVATITYTSGNLIALTAQSPVPNVDKIVKLYHSAQSGSAKLCIQVTPKEAEGIAAIPQKQNNVYYYLYGETIYLIKGSSAAAFDALGSTWSLWYTRIPTKVTATADTLDIRDKYVKLAIDKAKVMIYELLKQVPPEALTAAVNNSVMAIRNANLAELKTVKGGGSNVNN